MTLPIVEYTLLYNGRNITADISASVLSIEYTDKVKGESDELSVTLEDRDGKWQNDWYPDKGATLEFSINQQGKTLNCGRFEIDEIETQGSTSGDIVTIKALAAGPSKPLRTKKSYAHENKTLREIANTVATDLGLTLQGIVKDIRIGRVHQYQETPLQFLNRIGQDYGYIFSVRDNQLIFTYYEDLESRNTSLIFPKNTLITYNLKDTTTKVYKEAQVKHHSPRKKKVVQHTSSEGKQVYSNDSLELRVRAENEQQAEAKARYALYKHNSHMQEGSISAPGNILFLSGNNIELPDLGKYSGIYHITESSHNISRDGAYAVSGNIKRVK